MYCRKTNKKPTKNQCISTIVYNEVYNAYYTLCFCGQKQIKQILKSSCAVERGHKNPLQQTRWFYPLPKIN